MTLPAPFEVYSKKYEHVRMERDEHGILTMAMHTDGEDVVWGFDAHHEMGYAFQDVGNDDENKVIILTGTGDGFIRRDGTPPMETKGVSASDWSHVVLADGPRLTMGILNIPQPMIAAVNGPVVIHPELALLCDIVLASETADFGDPHHFVTGAVPGDGTQVIWPLLIGINRARYLMLTGQKIDAQTALEWGVVNEVLPKEAVMPRAKALALEILKRPQLTVRLTREVMLKDTKRLFADNVMFGLALEGLAAADEWPWGREGETTTR